MGALGIGTAILTRAGPRLVVKSVRIESHPEGAWVYNCTVDGDHTFYVGTASGGAWVHNGECVTDATDTKAAKGPKNPPLTEYNVYDYGEFNKSGREGDGLAGHELLQNSWLKANGHTEGRASSTGGDNPAIALGDTDHGLIYEEQKKLDLFKRSSRNLTAQDIIDKNLQAMRNANANGAKIPEGKIKQLERETRKWATGKKIL